MLFSSRAGYSSARTLPDRSRASPHSWKTTKSSSRSVPTPLAQSAVPALHMVGLSAVLAHRLVPIFGKDLLVALPKVAVEHSLTVTFGNTLPQFPTSLLAPVADRVSHHLAGTTPAQSQPNPAFALLFVDERPQLIQFQDLLFGGRGKRLLQRRQFSCF